MGSCDDGDDPAARAQTRRPGARVNGSDHDSVALIVPGGTSTQAQFDLLGLRAPHLAGPVRSIESPAAACQAAEGGPRGLTGCRVPGRSHPTDVHGIRKT